MLSYISLKVYTNFGTLPRNYVMPKIERGAESDVVLLFLTISPIFKFSKEVCTAFYTTNAIESLNSCYRRLNKQRSVFPSSQALMKALYLGTFEIAKKWTMPIRNWGKVRGELEIMYPERMSI